MRRAEALARAAFERSGHLATVRPDGRPHVVVVTFALVGGHAVTAIDHKPKRTDRLQRLVNVEQTGRASLLVDHYEEDWSRLWWVRIDGSASLHEADELYSSAIDGLVAKYAQYSDRAPEGPVIAISQDDVSSWESTP
ncbi:MAG TPA: TIGR03668 family PPOX class F420-dependent oxidoreductase [Acidimicrobiia bacterium]